MTTTFRSFDKDYDDGEYVKVTTQEITWPEICDTFFRFMRASGYIISERDVAEHFENRAEEVGDLFSNDRADFEFKTNELSPGESWDQLLSKSKNPF